VLVGYSTGDDAAVYRLTDELALVETVDIFTPVVDDPYDFGRIAAANALSDVYAMGARPISALSFVGWPVATLGTEPLGQLIEGACATCAEAGIDIVGGHSITDDEPKFGLFVTGLVHPDRVARNVGALEGDVLVLTKPLGIGVLTTAIKRGQLDETTARLAVETMARLNRAACEAMVSVGVSAATDVTGFGLLGHLAGMLRKPGLGARVWSRDVPLLPRALELAEANVCPGGSKRNLKWAERRVVFDAAVPPALRLLLADAQTSGGLLMAVPRGKSDVLLDALASREVEPRAVIGEVVPDAEATLHIDA